MQAVADAGPLIHSHEIDAMDCLSIFDTIYVGDVVWQETTGAGRVPESTLVGLGAIKRQSGSSEAISHFVQSHSLRHLHGGEREALCLCKSLNIPLLLTDDLAVRESATALGITPVGSVGIIARACYSQRLSLNEATSLMRKLQHESTLFVTATIIEMAVEQLQQSFN